MAAISWLPRLEQACIEATVVPMVGGLPPFPEADFLEGLRTRLQAPWLHWSMEPPTFLSEEQGAALASQMEADAFTVYCTAPPLEGTVGFSLRTEDLWELLVLCGGGSIEELRTAADPELSQGFLLFVTLQILEELKEQQWPPSCAWKIAAQPEGVPTLQVDLTLGREGRSWPIQLFATSRWIESCRKQFAPRPLKQLNEELAFSLRLAVDVGIGQVELSWKELQGVSAGDLLVLDRWHTQPDLSSGEAYLRLGAETIWSCTVDQRALTAKEPFPASLEESPMTIPPNSSTEGTDDDDFDWEAELDKMPDLADLAASQSDAEEPPDSEEEEGVEAEEAVSPPPSKERRAERAQAAPGKSSQPLRTEERLDRVQVQVTVSLGRFGMSMREIMDLRAGNVVDLPVAPDGRVDLLVGERRIGRGEIIQIDDLVGVRVLEI